MGGNTESFGFLGGAESITALRKVGYRNTAMAIGELIDNSIQAGANNVTIVLTTSKKQNIKRETTVIDYVATIDNGSGMDAVLLRNSLRLGNGTHHHDVGGMGKYGVGLPQSSISQAKKVDVWSWQNGNNPKHVFIDLTDDEWVSNALIEEPDDTPIPTRYNKFINKDHGTLVEWSELDNLDWKKPNTVFEHTESQLGRMYRYWLSNKRVSIRVTSIDRNGKMDIDNDRLFEPIDPLFLMEDAKKTADAPCNPLFEKYTDDDILSYTLNVNGENVDCKVVIKYSMARREVWPGDLSVTPGNTKYGSMTKKNLGVSIVREGRELELLDGWYAPDKKDSRNRWWGVEINFTRDLDDVFGVTNNKQSATKINTLMSKPIKTIYADYGIDDNQGLRKLDELRDEDYSSYILVDVVTRVTNKIALMMGDINNNNIKNQKIRRITEDMEMYDAGVIGRRNDDHSGLTDAEIEKEGDNHPNAVKEEAIARGYDSSDVETIGVNLDRNHLCSVIPKNTSSSAFFGVEFLRGHMVITLNTGHPVYEHLFASFAEQSIDSDSIISLTSIENANAFLRLIFEAWGRMEDESRTSSERQKYQTIREDWGRMLTSFMESYEEAKNKL